MDPLTQGLLGAAAATAAFAKPLGRKAVWVGLLGGTLADTDVLLSVWSDPGHPQELHRHFTHAIAFIPIGGFLAALPFLLWRGYRERAKWVFAAATLAYATHGLLDCCTSYGTHWLWPFSNARLSWDWIAVIDPLYTLPLLVAVIWAAICARAKPALIGLILSTAYMSFGVYQHSHAEAAVRQVATAQNRDLDRMRVMPTLGNLIVWRGLYVCDGQIHAMAVRVPLLGNTAVQEGGHIELFDPNDWPQPSPQRERIVNLLQRINLFADGYLARHPGFPSPQRTRWCHRRYALFHGFGRIDTVVGSTNRLK